MKEEDCKQFETLSYDIQKQSTVSKNHSTDFFIQSSEIMSIDE